MVASRTNVRKSAKWTRSNFFKLPWEAEPTLKLGMCFKAPLPENSIRVILVAKLPDRFRNG